MQLTPDTHREPNLVSGYAGGELRLRSRVLRSSSIITATDVVAWPVASVEALAPGDFEPVLALGVEVVLLGTGARLKWPPPEVHAHLASRGIGLEVMDLGAACRTFNLLVGDGRRAALAAVFEAR